MVCWLKSSNFSLVKGPLVWKWQHWSEWPVTLKEIWLEHTHHIKCEIRNEHKKRESDVSPPPMFTPTHNLETLEIGDPWWKKKNCVYTIHPSVLWNKIRVDQWSRRTATSLGTIHPVKSTFGKEHDWKNLLNIIFKWTNPTFYCQFNHIAIACGFLLLPGGGALAACEGSMSRHAARCLAKLL